MYEIIFSRTAENQLSKLDKNLRKRILSTLERIKIRPYSFVKRKQGTSHFILRVGQHRIILDIKNKKLKILVLEIGHRKNIYK